MVERAGVLKGVQRRPGVLRSSILQGMLGRSPKLLGVDMLTLAEVSLRPRHLSMVLHPSWRALYGGEVPLIIHGLELCRGSGA